MRYTPLVLATVFVCVAAPTLHARVSNPNSVVSMFNGSESFESQIIKIDDKKGEADKKKKIKKPKKKETEDANQKGNGASIRIKRSKDERVRESDSILTVRAPDGRDMTVLLGALPLALLGSGVVFADVPEDRLLTYRNCPPGLAKKNPPCVPPGLAKKGMTYEDWVGYDDVRLDEIYLDQRRGYLDQEILLEDGDLLLNSTQIATLYGLRTVPSGSRYALIDGQPVLLTDEDNTSLLRIYELSRRDNLPTGLRIAPTAALTQDELRQTYKLPILEPGYNYAVVNGELVTLQDSAFETLQLLRIARAVF